MIFPLILFCFCLARRLLWVFAFCFTEAKYSCFTVTTEHFLFNASEGSGNTSTPGSNGSMKRGSGKYWRVYVYTNIKGKQRNTKTNVRVQFALEDKERDFVEIHALIANMTVKKVTVTNITKQAFDKIRKELQKQQGNFQYIYIGKIREGRS